MRHSFIATISLSILLASCTHGYDTAAIDRAINAQMDTYPQSTLKDIYKNFFQDTFGPGHLTNGSSDARQAMSDYLRAECAEATAQPSLCPPYELTGWHHRFYRVDLSVINEGQVPFDTFLDALMQSSEQFQLPDVAEWAKEWDVICSETRRLYPTLPEFSRDSADIKQILSEGKYASHHSAEYNRAYHPHYRLIHRSVFRKKLAKLLDGK